MQKLDGFPVRSTMHMVLVPEGQSLDVEAVLRPREGDGGGMAAMVQRAESTYDAATGAPTQQVTLLRVTTHISDPRVDPIPASAFEIPSDYTQVDPLQPRADHK